MTITQQPTISLKLTPHQFEWLQTFLERSKMSGKEVPHFLSIVSAIRAVRGSKEIAPPDTEEATE